MNKGTIINKKIFSGLFFAIIGMTFFSNLNADKINHDEINRQDIGWNEFSRERNQLICDVDLRKDIFVSKNADVELQHANKGEYNGYHFHNLYFNGQSTITIKTNFEVDPAKKYYLNIDHCSTLIDGVPLSQINIIVNGTMVAEAFNAHNGGNFRQQHFDITEDVVNGDNTIVVQLNDNSVSQYWIHTLCVYAK